MKLSVVIPCLNESGTVAKCVTTALATMAKIDIKGETIVADNGSTDGSPGVAAAAGARIVAVPQRGYGNALMAGIREAEGAYIVMGDADDSYDFRQIPLFLEKLEEGNELVMGCRLHSGGGTILPRAMPFLHRHVGNPLFSFLARWWFSAPVHDVNCGMRAITADLYRRLDQECAGMEFAAEMVIKASLLGAKITELPIALRRDGRKQQPPHLRTFRDGWKTLGIFLALAPRAPGFRRIFKATSA